MMFSLTTTTFLVLALAIQSHSYHHHGRSHKKLVKRQAIQCDPNSKYRTIDGQCNNLVNTDWGSAGSFLRRRLPAAYGANAAPRTQGVSGPLPSAREVSLKHHGPSDAKGDITLMVMQWGQFLDHDMTLTPITVFENATDCCISSEEECFPIPLNNDEFFTDRVCLGFERSIRNTDPADPTGPPTQQNVLTAFIDGSNVYGSSLAELAHLRETDPSQPGELLDVNREGKEYLPEGDPDGCVFDASNGEYCALAGDERVNEQQGLTAMHTIWFRQHNIIARHIAAQNPTYTSDEVFQEARRIVGAMMQAISYNEFLPIVLGTYDHAGLGFTSNIYFYDRTLDPGIINGFATAAYRFGHSLIPEDLMLNGESIRLHDLFFAATDFIDNYNEITDHFSSTEGPAADRHFSHSITRHLFETQPQNGFDLVALNLQRGRDHGLPSYTAYRHDCDIPANDILGEFLASNPPPANGAAYSDNDDVDLFSGGMLENPETGGLLGPTFTCLLGDQFSRLKFGDRFFYLNKNGPQAFTDAQIAEFNKLKFSSVICDTTENTQLQENIFRPIDAATNPLKECNDIPGLDLSLF